MKTEFSGVCDIGKIREVNQDAIFMDAGEDAALFAVADGMGGHFHGEAASGIVVGELRRWWEEFQADSYRKEQAGETGRVLLSLQQRLELANRTIYRQYNSDTQICGSTVAVLFIYRDSYCVLSSGDSRIYYANGLRWKQLTCDDVWENQPGVIEQYRPAELRRNANYGKLVHAIGTAKEAVFSGKTDILKDDDRFLLCSDGLYKMCREKELKKIVRSYKGNKNGTRLLGQMMDQVYEKGARDNISCILVCCRE